MGSSRRKKKRRSAIGDERPGRETLKSTEGDDDFLLRQGAKEKEKLELELRAHGVGSVCALISFSTVVVCHRECSCSHLMSYHDHTGGMQ